MRHEDAILRPFDPAIPRDEGKARALTRITLILAGIIGIMGGTVAMVVSRLPHEYLFGSMNFVGAAVYFALIYPHAKGHVLVSRLALMIVGNFHLAFILIGYGWPSGAWMHYFLMMLVPFAILSRAQKAWITPMALLACFLLLGGFVAFRLLELEPLVVPNRPELNMRFAFNMLTNVLLVSTGSILLMRYMRNVHFQAEDILDREHQRSEELLLNVLPEPIAARLKRGEQPIADHLDEVTILFADIVGFTAMSERTSPGELVGMLNDIFTGFDELADRHGMEKIKTIGDCYMIVAGLPEPKQDHALHAARMAFEMLRLVESGRKGGRHDLRIRVGLHSGPVVAGVIGRRKFSYDLWGDAVNTASRMESHGAPGEITVTRRTLDLIEMEFAGIEREPVAIKGKGAMTTYFLRQRV